MFDEQPPARPEAGETEARWPYRTPAGWVGFAVLNFVIVFQLGAAFVGAAAVNPSSPVVDAAWEFYQPYLDATHTNHGWSFFSPEPGSSILLEYEAVREDGSVSRVRLPNFEIKPRLLYHRYFMLTEFSGRLRNAPREDLVRWAETFAHAISREENATQVTLWQVEHLLPSIERVQVGADLDAEISYQRELLGVYRWDN